MISIFLSLILLLAPLPAQGNGPAGTDEYLRRTMGYSDSELATPLATEKREPFPVVDGIITIDDPTSDIVDRLGTSSAMRVPWMDIVSASVRKNTDTSSWDFTMETAAGIPARSTEKKTQFFFMIDKDGDALNNETIGFNSNVDTEFTVEWDEAAGAWGTDYRWYNQPVDFWAFNKDTASTFVFSGNRLVYSVPFSELPEDAQIKWRLSAAVSDGKATAVDTAPGIGFPPPIGEPAHSASAFQFPQIPAYGYVLIVAVVGALIALIRIRTIRSHS